MGPRAALSIFRFFDLHATNVPILTPSLLHPEARFLFKKSSYNKLQRARVPVRLPHYQAIPLTSHLRHDYFLRSYIGAQFPCPDSTIDDFWAMLLPFRLVPLEAQVLFVPGNDAPKRKVQISLYVWPTGWSGNVSLTTYKTMTHDEVESLSCTLQGDERLFLWDGKAINLSGIFRRLTSDLLDNLFTNRDAVYGPPTLPRYRVVLLAGSTQERHHWDSMSGSERTQLHTILRGREVSDPERIRLQRQGKYTIISLSAHDFGLAEFDHGVLVSLADSWEGKQPSQLGCLASNIRKSMMMGFALARTISLSDENEGSVKDLREGARMMLSRLPEHYNNRIARAVYKTHHGLLNASKVDS